ncbi:SDR family oxidoreductase [Nocardia sp. NPDC004722]
MSGRRVLVTGGARSVGAAITRHFAERGATVLVNYFHSREHADALAARARTQGWRLELFRASVADRAQLDRMFTRIKDTHGGLDVLVNNAAAGAILPLDELDERYWQRAFTTNVMGTLWCSRRAAELMAPAGGSIVNLSSVGAHRVITNYAALGTTKAAVEHLTRYLAVELAPAGIRVNVASAGVIDSPVMQLLGLNESSVVATTPRARLTSAEELAHLVGFLASEQAAAVTGQVLLADGGASLPGGHSVIPATPVQSDRLLLTDPASRASCTTVTEPHADGANTATDSASAPSLAQTRPPVSGTVVSTAPALPGMTSGEPIAVVGAGVAAPGAHDLASMWTALITGQSAFGEPTRFDIDHFWATEPDAADRSYTRISGFLGEFPAHSRLAEESASGAWHSPEHAATILRHTLLQATDTLTARSDDRWMAAIAATVDLSPAIEPVAAQAMLDTLAGTTPVTPSPDRTGLLTDQWVAHALNGIVPTGTESVVLDTACSSAAYAVATAMMALREGSCDIAIAAAAGLVSPHLMVTFSKLGALAREDTVRALDAEGTGTLFSDGAAAVALKTLSRARADGDDILGVILGVGLASDGRGRAIHSPNPAGQTRALTRAWASAGVHPRDLDWIVAHGTGTPRGDTTELDALAALLRDRAVPCPVTSNKAVFGHTGPAAALLSILHVLLALRHSSIPAQPGITHPLDAASTPGSRLRVPTTATAWPRRTDTPRRAGVSAFGFGGTNAHLVIAEDHPSLPAYTPQSPPEDEVVVVGWAGAFPDMSADAVTAWLTGSGPAPAPDFGDVYPAPTSARLRLPASAIARMDRAQLLALRLASDLLGHLDTADSTVAVVIGSSGLSRTGLANHARIYLDALTAPEPLRQLIDQHSLPISEDSAPGTLFNLTAGRVANHFDLHGSNLAVDAGADTVLSVIRTAAQLLRHDHCDIALAGLLDADSHQAWAQIVGAPALGEGAVGLALTRAATARRLGLPVLGTLTSAPTASLPRPTTPARPEPIYRTLDSALPLLRAVLERRAHTVYPTTHAGRSVQFHPDTDIPDPSSDIVTVEFVPAQPRVATRTPLAAIPPHTIVLTDLDLDLDAHTDIAVLRPDTIAADRIGHLLEELPFRPSHIRVITNVGPGPHMGIDRLLALHDLLFETARLCGQDLLSCAQLLGDAVLGRSPSPTTGLFSGFTKGLRRELRDCWCATILTDLPAATAMELLATESGYHQAVGVVAHVGNRRLEPALVSATVTVAAEFPLTAGSVVVATGGATGITAAALVGLAERVGAHFYLLGRSEPATDAGPPPSQEQYLRAARIAEPHAALTTLLAEYRLLRRGSEIRGTLDRLTALVGTDKVTYLQCDVTDAAAVEHTVAEVLARHGRIDLLVHAAGHVDNATLPRKRLPGFQKVRDVKVIGYLNLKQALAENPPTRWCNFSSYSALAGTPGMTDYLSANDFLCSSAQSPARASNEFSIAWMAWSGVGMVDDLIEQRLRRGGPFVRPLDPTTGSSEFLRALSWTTPPALTCFLRPSDRALLTADGLTQAPPPHTARPHRTATVSTATESTGAKTTVRRTYHCDTHGWLSGHRYRTRPILPGSAILDLAVEAARQLVPHAPLLALSNARFHTYLRAFDTPARAEATIIATTATVTTVRVRILSDLVGPSGALLRPDTLHATTDLLFGPPAPAERRHPRAAGAAAVAPVRLDTATDLLHISGVFDTINNVRRSTQTLTADYHFAPGPWVSSFATFHTPIMLLDTLARLSLYLADPSGHIPIGLLAGFDTLTTVPLDDVALTAEHPLIQLRWNNGEYTATTPSGAELARITGVLITTVGDMNPSTGAVITRPGPARIARPHHHG